MAKPAPIQAAGNQQDEGLHTRRTKWRLFALECFRDRSRYQCRCFPATISLLSVRSRLCRARYYRSIQNQFSGEELYQSWFDSDRLFGFSDVAKQRTGQPRRTHQQSRLLPHAEGSYLCNAWLEPNDDCQPILDFGTLTAFPMRQ